MAKVRKDQYKRRAAIIAEKENNILLRKLVAARKVGQEIEAILADPPKDISLQKVLEKLQQWNILFKQAETGEPVMPVPVEDQENLKKFLTKIQL
jgi:hypothetical protein